MGRWGLKRNETGSELESWVVGTWGCTVLFAVLFRMFLAVCNQMAHQHTARKLAEDIEEPELGHLLGDGLMRWSDLLAQRVEWNLNFTSQVVYFVPMPTEKED